MKGYAVIVGVILSIVVALWVVNVQTAKAPGPISESTATSTTDGGNGGGGGSIMLYNSGVSGNVSIGPTCPVMRDPPDPKCADKPYATAIVVYRTGSKSPFIIGNSDMNGVFKFLLPPGSYTLSASGGTTLPRCSPVDVTVGPSGYATTTISCDTGIR